MSNVERAFERYVKGTPKKAIVTNLTIVLCTLTNQVEKVCEFETSKVHITTRMLKKNYDKRPNEENDILLAYGWKIVRFPDHVYKNKDGKRGHYFLVKRMKNHLYGASIEVEKTEESYMLYVATMFRIQKDSYLNGYNLIWSWKGGDPSS